MARLCSLCVGVAAAVAALGCGSEPAEPMNGAAGVTGMDAFPMTGSNGPTAGNTGGPMGPTSPMGPGAPVAMPTAGQSPMGPAVPGDGMPADPVDPEDLPSADELFADVNVAELSRVHTIQEVTWSQRVASDSTHLAFMFENDQWHESPARAGAVGEYREVVLGAPEGVELSIKLVAAFGQQVVESQVINVTNGMAPSRLPRVEIEAYDADLASPHRFMMGSVSEGGSGSYNDTHWMYIIDRQGRVVWYQPSAGGNGSHDSGYAPRISPDGTHISYDQMTRFDDGYLKLATLDFTYERDIRMPGIGDGHAVASDGSVLYEDGERIWEVSPDDESASNRREVFRCNNRAVPQDRGVTTSGSTRSSCYANALNYDPASDSVVISYPDVDTAVQVARDGSVLRTFGELGPYDIQSGYEFDFNHWAHITPDGTLIVSSHRVGTMVHLFNEFEIDDDADQLRLIWSYGEDAGNDYPAERGMVAAVVGHENRIANYGPTGVILEITQAGEVAWRVKFSDNALPSRSLTGTPLPAGTRGNLVHNNFLLDDLYALNRGPGANP